MSGAARLIALDHRLFRQLNSVWTNPVLDRLMPFLTDLDRSHVAVFLVLPALVAFWLWRDRKNGPRAALAVAAAVGAADAICHLILKPWVHRLRPEFGEAMTVLRTGGHSKFGFPSNHAANSFAAAVVLGYAYPRMKLPSLLIATVIAYSRVYVGAHYPADVVGGALVGAAFGALAAAALSRRGGKPIP